MQFAQVIPHIKTAPEKQSFLYKIPPECLPDLAVGSLVQIPLKNRQIEGIVVKFQKSSGKIKPESLKSINKVLEKSIIDTVHLRLARWMAQYYLTPLSLCLFEMIALPLKKKLPPKINAPSPLSSPLTRSWEGLKKLCQKIIQQQKQIIILCPNINEAEEIFSTLSRNFTNTVLYHGQLNKSQRYHTFLKIKNQQVDIVIGSHLAIFAPLPRLGLIVIWNEHDNAYKNDRNPRYHVREVAKKLSEITGAKLLLISPTPSLESYFAFQEEKTQNVFLIRQKYSFSVKTTIVNMQTQFLHHQFSPLSLTLQEALKENYHQNKKSLLFVARKGAASYIFCQECGYIFRCPRCDLPLIYNIYPPQKHYFICYHCLYKTPPALTCPNCHSFKLKYSGSGTQKIEAEIKKILLKPNIIRIDQDVKDIRFTHRNDIIIGTQKIFPYLREKIHLVAVVSADNILNIPDFKQGEKFFSTIARLKNLAKEHFLLQTQNPENPLIKYAANQDYPGFYRYELSLRKKLGYPPFYQLIRLLCQNKDEKKCQQESEEVAGRLKNFLTLAGPAPCFYTRLRNRARWQIVIKLPRKARLPQKVSQLLQSLPSHWIIDVDPESLL